MANEFVARKGLISQGGFTLPEKQISSTYTIGANDYFIECTANTFTVNLPAATTISGKVYVIKNIGSGVITVDANGSETIDGSLTKTLNQNDVIQVTSNGTNWIITGGIGVSVVSNSMKSGSVASGSFTGDPKKYNVVFSSNFSNVNYSPVITGGDARSWTVENISVSGFTINSNSNTSLSYTTYWIAVLNT